MITIQLTRTRLVWCALIALAVVAALVVAGCAKITEPFNDAPVSHQIGGPAEVGSMPDGFNNVATKCDHGNRLYISYHGDGSYGFGFAVPRDPTC